MKKFFNDFKEFAIQGNVISIAVGMIIGLAFQSVVSSLTDNIISPIIGLFARQDFDYMEWSIFGATLRYGVFITSVINFIILAFVVFLMTRGMNKLLALGHKEAAAEPDRLCDFCKTVLHKEATRCPACTSILE